jgi:hypothetical protein
VFFARGIISPGQKWWQTLLGREISWSQWEGPSMHSKSLAFFHFKFRVGGGKDFFSFFPGSQCIPTMFPWGFPSCSQYFLHSTSLLSHMLWQMLSSFHLYTWAGGAWTLCFIIEHFDFRNLHNFTCFEWWANQIGSLKKKNIKIELGRHLI